MPLGSSFLIATYIQCHVSLHGLYLLSLPAWLQLLSVSVSANQDTVSNKCNHMPIGYVCLVTTWLAMFNYNTLCLHVYTKVSLLN